MRLRLRRGESSIHKRLAGGAGTRPRIAPGSPSFQGVGISACVLARGPSLGLPLYNGLLDYDSLVRYSYATALAQLGRYEESAAHFRIVTQALPSFAPAYNDYGNLLRLMGHLESAVEQFQRALPLEPGFASARSNLELVFASLEEGE